RDSLSCACRDDRRRSRAPRIPRSDPRSHVRRTRRPTRRRCRLSGSEYSRHRTAYASTFFTGGGAPPPPRTHADASLRLRRPSLGMAAGALPALSPWPSALLLALLRLLHLRHFDSLRGERLANRHVALGRAGHRAFDDQQVILRIDPQHLQVVRRDPTAAHTSGRAHALDHA